MNNLLTNIIKSKINLDEIYIKNIITLLEQGCTIPFIARYRKNLTGNMDDQTLLKFQEAYEYTNKFLQRKQSIENILKEKGFLNTKIQKDLDEALTITKLEDIYEPYKDVKNSRAQIAQKNGLSSLANIISTMKYSTSQIEQKAKKFLHKDIKSIDDAINGAKDIIALRYSQEIRTKDHIRKNIQNYGRIVTKEAKEFDPNGLFKDLANIDQKASYIKSHRLLAILRAVEQKQLSVKIEVDTDYLIDGIKKFRIPKDANSSSKLVFEAYSDGLKRLLLPSLKREFLNSLKEKAQDEAIELFGKNLSKLLLTPPLVNQIILGMDPGYKAGCKCAVINQQGDILDSFVIYLLNSTQTKNACEQILNILKKYSVTAIAIGNGTASKETADFIANLIDQNSLKINYAVVSEIGASVYSASKIASQEYPNLDVTLRGAVSIAQRLRDPMAALVKIDPKSLGIGQYQHDVDQKKLSKKLESETINLVNKVGVDLNSASYKLLSFVSGLSENLAKNIIEYKQTIKGFKTKSQLLKVKGLGAKTYEQCVGFVRIKDGKSFLDNTGIHPESYDAALFIKENFDLDNITNEDIKALALKFKIDQISLEDIVFELIKPGFDIRKQLDSVAFCQEVKSFEQLQVGDEVRGVVRNITDFGAFVDIGLKNDALLHISKISQKRISHPLDVLSINQHLDSIKIDSIDKHNSKISLSLI